MKTEPWMQFPDAEVLRRVTVRLIEPSERERWDRLMVERHDLASSCLVGRQLRYVAEVDGKWVGLVGWSTPAYHLKGREAWIDWSVEQMLRRRDS